MSAIEDRLNAVNERLDARMSALEDRLNARLAMRASALEDRLAARFGAGENGSVNNRGMTDWETLSEKIGKGLGLLARFLVGRSSDPIRQGDVGASGGASASAAKTVSAEDPWQLSQSPFVTGDFVSANNELEGKLRAMGFDPDLLVGSPLDMMVLPGFPPGFERHMKLANFIYGIPEANIGPSDNDVDHEAKLEEIRNAEHARKLDRIERDAPQYVSKYKTIGDKTITWDRAAAAVTGATFVPWDMKEFWP